MRIILILPLVLGLVAYAPGTAVVAQERDQESPGELARQGLESLLRALDAFVDIIPQYEAPELTEDGDIIIRRKPRPDRPPQRSPRQDPEIDETRT